MKKQKTQLKGVLILMLTAMIWGSSFVAQSIGMEKIDAFTFNGIRILMGAAFLLPIIAVKYAVAGRNMTAEEKSDRRKTVRRTIFCGAVLGVIFFVAGNLQQFAFYWSTSGKIAFLTSLYMFFVPMFGLVIGKRVAPVTWLCVVAGFAGVYMLTIDPAGDVGINKGDILAFLCAVVYGVHILWIERVSDEVDGVLMSAVQFAVAGGLSFVMMFIFEKPNLTDIKSAILPLLYSGIMSCGVAYTLQIVGQKYTEATVAGLIMCTESVFAVLSAAIVLHELMTVRETVGCVVMFAAIVVSQLEEAGVFRREKHLELR